MSRVALYDRRDRYIDDDNPLAVKFMNGLVPERYDQIDLEYNANKDVSVVKYYYDSVLITTLTLSYDAEYLLTSVVKS